MIQRAEYPILEYDPSPSAVIMPRRNDDPLLPELAVFLFLRDEVETFAASRDCRKVGEFETITKVYPIYTTIYKEKEICFCQAPLGGAAAAQFLDYLICCGVKKVIATGTCGDLTGIEENAFLIPTAALRDEGASYHYLPPSRWAETAPEAVNAIAHVMEREKIPYRLCKTWSTDGFYRETAQMVQYRKEEGCAVVDMECASMAACAAFRGAIFGQILFTADTLADTDQYDEREWGKNSFPAALHLALESVCALDE